MTYEKIFEKINDLYPNEYEGEGTKKNARYKDWCREVDAEVVRNTKKEDTPIRLYDQAGECLIEEPYSDAYIFYICAQIAFWQRDYDAYNAHISLYKARMDEYNSWYIRTYGGEVYKFRGWI